MDPTPETCTDGGSHSFDLGPVRSADKHTLTQEGWCQKCCTVKLDRWEWDGTYDYKNPGAKCSDLFGHSWGDMSDLAHQTPNMYVGYEWCGICGARRSVTFRHGRAEHSFPGKR